MPGRGDGKGEGKPKPGEGSKHPGEGKPPPPSATTPKAGAAGGATPSGTSTPKEGENITLKDYKELREICDRLAGERDQALGEVDRLVRDVRQLEVRDEERVEREEDLSILDMTDTKSTKVPPFTGTDKDDYSADIWVSNVERLAALNGWRDDQTLSGCLLALKEVASVWRESEQRLGSTSLTTWDRFKVAFKSRFQEARSAVEQVSIISNLRQQPKESVRDFFDSVNNSVHLSANDSLVEMRADATKTTAVQGFQACITHFMRVHYVSGLKPEVRRLVEAKFSSLKSKEDLIKAAVEAEVASGQESRHIAVMEAELAEMRLSVAAYQQTRGTGRAGLRGSRGASRGARAPVEVEPVVAGVFFITRRCPTDGSGSCAINAGNGGSIGQTSVNTLLPRLLLCRP